MIQRIKSVKAIGNFHNFSNGGAVPLADSNKVTSVFGRNTLGKTTLAAIFDSLGSNRPELVLDRATIPPIAGTAQQAEITYLDKAGQHATVKFKSNLWEASDLVGRLFVFDQDFIHRHLITGIEVTRQNREEFTNFILGEEGVALSEEIEQLSKELRQKKTVLPGLRPPYATKEGMDEKNTLVFVNSQVDQTEDILQKAYEAAEKSLHRLEKTEDFNRLPALTLLVVKGETDLDTLQQTFSDLLQTDYKNIGDDAKAKILEHTNTHCTDSEAATIWLKHGLQLKAGDACPFCSQSTVPVAELIETFQLVFNEEFEKYEKTIKTSVSTLSKDFNVLNSPGAVGAITIAIQQIKHFEPFLDGIAEATEGLEAIALRAQRIEQEIKTAFTPYYQAVSTALQNKQAQPHNALQITVDDTDIRAHYAQLDALYNEANAIIQSVAASIATAKEKIAGFTPEQIAAAKTKLELEMKQSASRLARLQETEACKAYLVAKNDIDTTTKTIEEKRKQLETEQSEYLEKYFSSLNELFKKFGSQNFGLVLNSSNRGDKKTYFLDVTFQGHVIRPEQICKVFSESDKRSLALAIFFCKTNSLPDKDKVILVLDDPVVSFDDNRINESVRLIKEYAAGYAQIIVLTHYTSLVERLHLHNADCKFLEIKQTTSGSELAIQDVENFVLTPHEKTFKEISEFIAGDDSIDVRRALRPFMEEHIKLLFAQQVAANGLGGHTQLNALIDGLHTANCYDDAIKAKLHGFRESLNPDHHASPRDDNPAGTRVDAQNLFDLLYNDLV